MRINYYGQIENTKQNTRTASITWSEKEQALAERLFNLMDIQLPEYSVSQFDGMALVEIADKEEYEEVKNWYKERKRMLQNCIKFGF